MRATLRFLYVLFLLPVIVPSILFWTVINAFGAGKEISTDIAVWMERK